MTHLKYRVSTISVPSEFIKFDANAHAADSYVNVRDMQVLRENNNILLAQRVRRTAMTTGGITATGWSTFKSDIFADQRSISHRHGNPIFQTLFNITPNTKSVDIHVAAYVLDGSSTADVTLYPVIDGYAFVSDVDTSLSMTIAGSTTALQTDSVTVNVPPEVIKDLRVRLTLYAKTPGLGSASTANVVDAGDDWIVLDTNIGGTLVYRTALYYVAAYQIEGGIIQAYLGSPAANEYKYKMEEGWNIPPSPGDVMYYETVQAVVLNSISVIENEITDFYITVDRP